MKKELLLPYKYPFLMLVIGALLIALVWDTEIAWLSWAAGIIAVALIVLALLWTNIIADGQYEAYLEEKQSTVTYRSEPGLTTQKLIYYPTVTIATILIYGITVSGSKVENYVNWKRFMLEVLIIGTIAGIAVMWLYSKKYSIKFTNVKWDEHMKVALFLVPLLSVLHFSIWYNHLEHSDVSRIAKGVVISDGDQYLHIVFEGQEQRFTFGRGMNETFRAGDSVWMTIKKGALGYPFLSKLSRIK